MERILEVCAGNIESAVAAAKAGAKRIELCADLLHDGLTPPLSVLQEVRKRYPDLVIHVLIRPRDGDFVYNHDEVDAMERVISAMLPWADGIVCGALTADGEVDVTTMNRLVHASNGKSFTYHRAFDVCRNPFKALDQIIESGCDRVLTSGQQPTAEQGIELLCKLQEYAASRIIVMPGGGVNSENARRILDITKCHEIHGSASLGTGVTQEAEVRRIIASLE